jgi:hypothetical protein
MRQWWLIALALLVAPGLALGQKRSWGDEDPYPLACIDFSGNWASDEGDGLTITQGSQCRWLRLRSTYNSHDGATMILPDGKVRSISGAQWKGTVRHRWNNKSYATIIETYRTLYYPKKVVTELVLLEKVNDNLLLESIYRSTVVRQEDGKDCEAEPEYSQRVFRLQGAAGRSGRPGRFSR